MIHWSDRVNQHLDRLGWSKAEFARRLNIDERRIYPQLNGKVAAPRGDLVTHMAELLGVHEHWIRTGKGPVYSAIPLVGYVSAGEEFFPYDDHAPGAGLDEVKLDIGDGDPIAIGVRGTSMVPVYRPGDTLICSRRKGADMATAIGRDCVIKSSSGAGWVKRVMAGSTRNRFNLMSYNMSYDPLIDIEVDWLAPVVIVLRS
jgi:transcriptional regulator with XRE-family HTH domain